MSADLFAEFGADPPQTQQQQPDPPDRPSVQHADPFAFFDGWSATTAPVPKSRRSPPISSQLRNNHSLSQVVTAAVGDNDEWGDFEGGTTTESISAVNHDSFAFAAPQASQPSLNPSDVGPPVQDLFSSASSFYPQSNREGWQKAPIVEAKKSLDPSVLFDAEDDLDVDDDDDFGDFEGTETNDTTSTLAVAPSSTLVDLVDDLSVSQPTATIANGKKKNCVDQATKPSSSARKDPIAKFGDVSEHKQPPSATVPTPYKDDAWDTFDDWEASIPTKTTSARASTAKADITGAAVKSSTATVPILSPTTLDPQPGELPPTNVPPPGVLLSLFSSLFMETQEKLFKPMAAQSLTVRNKLLANPVTIANLQGYLMLANVAAHIIAGRKLRWKRDQHLSQGMRIGPASSRATSGMKLTGIDKGENMKEEREVSDVVRVWKEQVGRVRHIISGANQIKAGTLNPAPDLQEAMPVKSLKQSEGGIPARQPCMLCGLKREERVTAADLSTDDSFGEWWTDQVNMHRGCRNFWNEHKDRLRQR